MKRLLLMVLTVSLFILVACGENNQKDSKTKKSADQEELETLYVNKDWGFEVKKTTGWTKGKVKTSKSAINVTFNSDKIKAIITVISGNKSVEEVKKELQTASGKDKVQILNNDDDYLSFKTKRDESIRTEVFFKKLNDNIYIYTFLTPTEAYKNNEANIEKFKNNIFIER